MNVNDIFEESIFILFFNIFKFFFNRDLNRYCLVYMFFFTFFRKKISCPETFFVYVKFQMHNFLRDLQSFHFVFKMTISKMRNLCSSIFHKIFETNSCEIMHYGKSLISGFQEFFVSINKTFILAARLGTRLTCWTVPCNFFGRRDNIDTFNNICFF